VYKQSFSCKINCTEVKYTSTKLHRGGCPDKTGRAVVGVSFKRQTPTPHPCSNANYQLKSLQDFVINRFFMKLFRTSNMHVVSDCRDSLILSYPVLARRAEKFVNKLHVD